MNIYLVDEKRVVSEKSVLISLLSQHFLSQGRLLSGEERLNDNNLLLLLLSCFNHVRLCATLWTAAHQAPLSTGFSRQEYWSGFSCPSPHNQMVST